VPGPGYTVIVQRNGSLRSRQLRLPEWLVRVALIVGGTALLGMVALVVAYGPIVEAAARAPFLQHRVTQLTRENARVDDLARALSQAEARYAQLRRMLGAELPAINADSTDRLASGTLPLYVAPPILAVAPSAAGSTIVEEPAGPSIPHRWPLSVPSYRTRGMVIGSHGEEMHPGIDLAVPEGSDVRASGGGVVERTGTDSSYGLFVLLQHPDGYESMYGHLSRVLVSPGEPVNAGQVIALSGNTGRSTAPHLHFEIRHYGRSVDPTTLVREGP
jgi:murein DD-endopeptidase MepM/ murein hydrolase activator NlpD